MSNAAIYARVKMHHEAKLKEEALKRNRRAVKAQTERVLTERFRPVSIYDFGPLEVNQQSTQRKVKKKARQRGSCACSVF